MIRILICQKSTQSNHLCHHHAYLRSHPPYVLRPCGHHASTKEKNKASQASICDCRRLTQWVSDVTRTPSQVQSASISPDVGDGVRPCTARANWGWASHPRPWESSNQESLLKKFRPQIERSPSATRPKRYGDCDSARRKNCYTPSTASCQDLESAACLRSIDDVCLNSC